MKKIYYLYLFIINIFLSNCLLSQSPCNDSKCLDEKYPYLFCNPSDNSTTTICTSDPNNVPGYQPFKQAGAWKYQEGSFKIVSNETGPCNMYIYDGNKEIFNCLYAINEMSDAFNVWNALCTPKLDVNQSCTVTIRFSQNKYDFLDRKYPPDSTTAYTQQDIEPLNMSICKQDCDSSSIVINQTNEFTGASVTNPCDYSKHFFITGTNEKSGWYNFYATVAHEMGHYFGFGDQYTGEGLNCRHKTSIMNNTGFESGTRNLTDDDKCMYEKLYCCSNTQHKDYVKENNKAIIKNINIYPNPVSDELIINLNNITDYNNSITIYNVYGEKITELPLTDKIDVSNLTTGAYYLQCGYKIIKFIKK